MAHLSLQHVQTNIPTDVLFRPFSSERKVTLFWVDNRHLASNACASAQRVSQEDLDVFSSVPVPLHTRVWIVFPDGTGFWGAAESCRHIDSGYLARLHPIEP